MDSVEYFFSFYSFILILRVVTSVFIGLAENDCRRMTVFAAVHFKQFSPGEIIYITLRNIIFLIIIIIPLLLFV